MNPDPKLAAASATVFAGGFPLEIIGIDNGRPYRQRFKLGKYQKVRIIGRGFGKHVTVFLTCSQKFRWQKVVHANMETKPAPKYGPDVFKVTVWDTPVASAGFAGGSDDTGDITGGVYNEPPGSGDPPLPPGPTTTTRTYNVEYP